MKISKNIIYACASLLLLIVLVFTISFLSARDHRASQAEEPAVTQTLPPSTPTPAPTPEPTPAPPAITPPAASGDPASGTDIVLATATPATGTDITTPTRGGK